MRSATPERSIFLDCAEVICLLVYTSGFELRVNFGQTTSHTTIVYINTDILQLVNLYTEIKILLEKSHVYTYLDQGLHITVM